MSHYYIFKKNGQIIGSGDQLLRHIEYDEYKRYDSYEDCVSKNLDFFNPQSEEEKMLKDVAGPDEPYTYAIKTSEAARYLSEDIHNESTYLYLILEAELEGISPKEMAERIIENSRPSAQKEVLRRSVKLDLLDKISKKQSK